MTQIIELTKKVTEVNSEGNANNHRLYGKCSKPDKGFQIKIKHKKTHSVLSFPAVYLCPSALTCANDSKCSFFSWFNCVSSSETLKWGENRISVSNKVCFPITMVNLN